MLKAFAESFRNCCLLLHRTAVTAAGSCARQTGLACCKNLCHVPRSRLSRMHPTASSAMVCKAGSANTGTSTPPASGSVHGEGTYAAHFASKDCTLLHRVMYVS